MSDHQETVVVPKQYLFAFVLVTSLIALWGFANDVTNPLVAVFKDVFVINNAQSTWVQMAFYGGNALIGISACMSLMFPTIYGLALDGVGEDAKLGSAGLIIAIVGGAFMPRLQGQILDLDGFMGTSATRGSFYLPAVCFVVIAGYGVLCWKGRRIA